MDISEKHKLLLEAQEKQSPQLTLRQMGEVLGIASTGHIRYILNLMVNEGLAEKTQRGLKSVYHIKSGFVYKHNEGKHE
jgi:predicted transcriptional regulator